MFQAKEVRIHLEWILDHSWCTDTSYKQSVQRLRRKTFFDGAGYLQRLSCKDFKDGLHDTGPPYSGSFKNC